MSPKVRCLLMLKTAVLLWGGTAMFAKAIPSRLLALRGG